MLRKAYSLLRLSYSRLFTLRIVDKHCSSITVIALSVINLIAIGTVAAMDLQPVEVNPIKVGTCAHQLRFKVKLTTNNREYGTKGMQADYRIGIYASLDKNPLTTFSVLNHKIGDQLVFVVPSDVLSCVNNVTIVVDDQNQFTENNKSNNKFHVKWKRQGKSFANPCAHVLEKCHN